MPSDFVSTQSGGQQLVTGSWSGNPVAGQGILCRLDDAAPGPVYVGQFTPLTVKSGGDSDGVQLRAGEQQWRPRGSMSSGDSFGLAAAALQSGSRLYLEVFN